MKITPSVLATTLSLTTIPTSWALSPKTAFLSPTPHPQTSTSFNRSKRKQQQQQQQLHSIAPQAEDTTNNGRTTKEIAKELSLGKTLDDGPVIDFGAVKDTSSRAERALAEARRRYVDSLMPEGSVSGSTSSSANDASSSSTNTEIKKQRLMGINDEVVAEVGYEIGDFVQEYVDVASGETVDELVQKCGAWLRSLAVGGTFGGDSTIEDNDTEAKSVDTEKSASSSIQSSTTTTFNPKEISRYQSLLTRAYTESGIVTSAFAKTFYLGTQVLPPPAMHAIWAIYVWCRRTDEIVDAPRLHSPDPNGEMLRDLSEWEIRTEKLFQEGDIVDVLDLPLLDVKVKYPNLSIVPFIDMIRGMLMDIPGLGQERYETWEELHLYCYRVAGTVGLMSMPVFGCAEGFTDEIAK